MTASAGPEGRQRVAHGVSRGMEEPSDCLSPGGAAEAPAPDLSPLPGQRRWMPHPVPRLTPWATFCRRSAAPGLLAPQVSANGPTAWVAGGPWPFGRALKGRDKLRYFAPSGLVIRPSGFVTLGVAQGFVSPPLRGSGGFETTFSVSVCCSGALRAPRVVGILGTAVRDRRYKIQTETLYTSGWRLTGYRLCARICYYSPWKGALL